MDKMELIVNTLLLRNEYTKVFYEEHFKVYPILYPISSEYIYIFQVLPEIIP